MKTRLLLISVIYIGTISGTIAQDAGNAANRKLNSSSEPPAKDTRVEIVNQPIAVNATITNPISIAAQPVAVNANITNPAINATVREAPQIWDFYVVDYRSPGSAVKIAASVTIDYGADLTRLANEGWKLQSNAAANGTGGTLFTFIRPR